MKYLLILASIALTACGDASRITEPNAYRKCSEYSIRPDRTVTFDLMSDETTIDTTWVMTYNGRDVALTDAQAARLDIDPTGVCREVM